MLHSIGLLDGPTLATVQTGLRDLDAEVAAGTFTIDHGVEDVHSQVELLLTQRVGDAGKKIHSGRSRNDQVLVDLKLYFRTEIESLVNHTQALFDRLTTLSETHKAVLLPGYTHLQIAMPSSFGLWFGAYAASLVADLALFHAAWPGCTKNPLGSAAGEGSPFPLARRVRTDRKSGVAAK